MSPESKPFTLVSFEEEAQALLDRARLRARELLQKALDEAKVLREQAVAEGRQEGYARGQESGLTEGTNEGLLRGRSEGKNEGLSEGLTRGLEEGRAQARSEMEESLQSATREYQRVLAETSGLAGLLKSTVEGIEGQRRKLIEDAERDLLRLSLTIAERLVRRTLVEDPKWIAENVKHAIALCANRKRIEVHVHPDDFTALEAYVPQLQQMFMDVSSIQSVPDPSIGVGGCRVVTEEGEVDADLERQLKEIEKRIFS